MEHGSSHATPRTDLVKHDATQMFTAWSCDQLDRKHVGSVLYKSKESFSCQPSKAQFPKGQQHIFQDILKFNMPKGKCGKKGKALKKPSVELEQSLHISDDGEESDPEEDLTQPFQPTQQEKIHEEPCLKKVKRMKLVLTDAEEEDLVKWIKDHPALYDKTSKAYKDEWKTEALLTNKAKEMGQESRFIFLLIFGSFLAILLVYLLTN